MTLELSDSVSADTQRAASTRARPGEREIVLLRELEHRNRNLIALVRAISRQLLPLCASLEEFSERFDTRLKALARAESLLTGHRSAPLGELVRIELEAVGAPPERWRLDGGEVRLPSELTQAMALALHELATNAIKHGPLSARGGSISVRWRLHDERGGRPRLSLYWIESCAASVIPLPDTPRRGFGRQLIEEALTYQFRARTALAIKPRGLRCTIELPL